MKRFFLLFCALMSGLFFSGLAFAHPTPGSTAFIDFTVDGGRLEQDVPIEELERALHRSLLEEGESPEQMLRRNGSLLQTYAAEHLRVLGQDHDKPWRFEVVALEGHIAEDGPRVLFRFRLYAPDGQASHSVRIHDDIVAHEVVSHYTHVYVRSDWAAGTEYSNPLLAGVIHAGHFDVDVNRSGSFFTGFRSVVKLGIEHIASGSDHVLFVLLLVLVAPIRAIRGRWQRPRTSRETAIALAKIVSAFTVGHSVTLILGALGWVVFSPAIIEPAIALTILVTAVHAFRPLFPNREVLVAAAFGLVHGLAFASNLPQRDLGAAQTAWTLFGFNAGIELGQLMVITSVVPWILIIARTPAFTRFRMVGASLAGLLALGWLVERTTNLANPAAWFVALLETHSLQLLVVLATFSILLRAIHSHEAADHRIRE